MASLRSYIIRTLVKKINLWNRPLPEIRQKLVSMNVKLKTPKNVEIKPIQKARFKGEWIIPKDAPHDKAIVYIHGGGYCIGIVNTNRNFVSKLAKELGIKIFLLDYRLAPENPFPAAIEDSISLYKWLLEEGYKSKNIGYIADSSGCGLCLSTMFSIRGQNITLPAALAFISPVIDFSYSGKTHKTKSKFDPYQLKQEFFISNNYVKGNDPKDPSISPLYGEFEELPPMLIHASDYDVFLDDSIKLYEKSQNAGVKSSIKVWRKMWHIFHMSENVLPEGREAMNEIKEFIKDKVS